MYTSVVYSFHFDIVTLTMNINSSLNLKRHSTGRTSWAENEVTGPLIWPLGFLDIPYEIRHCVCVQSHLLKSTAIS